MSEKTWRCSDTDDEIRLQVEKAIKALTGIQAITIANVASRASMRLHASENVVKKFLEDMPLQERIKLGFPDPHAPKAPKERVLRGDMGVVRRLQVPLPRR